jgi:glycosyltransferase involved in cell wall biosynthesis
MKISYAILTHNEGEEIDRLLNFLVSNKRKEDEIVIVDDNSTDDKTIEVLEKFRSEIVLKTRNFDGDATQKNFLNSHCTGDYILQLDADEIMTADFIKMLPEILKTNETVDLFFVPRINTVEGLTQDHIDKWKWNVNDKGWVNFPDWQMRLYRNCEWVKWEGLLHSKIVGFKTYVALPTDELFCMLHPKEIDRQEAQNNLYDKIEANGRQKYKV